MQQGRRKTIRRGTPALAEAGKARFNIEYNIAVDTLLEGAFAECNADAPLPLEEFARVLLQQAGDDAAARLAQNMPLDRFVGLVKLSLSKYEISWKRLMGFLRAFTYMFKDQHWLVKLAETALFVALCPAPVIGLLCLCALLGYLAEIVHNVSGDYPRPLPEWDHIGEDIGKGAQVLLAIVVYHLPPLILIGLLYVFREALAVSLFGSITFVGVLAAILPFVMVYFAIAWTLLAIGLVEYADSWDSGAFYQFDKLLRALGNHSALSLQWLVYSLAASMLMLLLLPLAPFIFFPAQGYLTGNFGRRLRAARMSLRDAGAGADGAAIANRLRFATPEGHASPRRNETA